MLGKTPWQLLFPVVWLQIKLIQKFIAFKNERAIIMGQEKGRKHIKGNSDPSFAKYLISWLWEGKEKQALGVLKRVERNYWGIMGTKNLTHHFQPSYCCAVLTHVTITAGTTLQEKDILLGFCSRSTKITERLQPWFQGSESGPKSNLPLIGSSA